ncbi:hypothetical protein JOF41_001602 [Saccharothrix coeruleofusca]|nr:hypothetical protein [Saccharothrix coeruleofusca]
MPTDSPDEGAGRAGAAPAGTRCIAKNHPITHSGKK